MDDWEFRVNDTDALLVVLDSVRASNLGLYTHINEATPFLETFGEQATVYTEVRAPSIGCWPSHASLFTGHHAADSVYCDCLPVPHHLGMVRDRQ